MKKYVVISMLALVSVLTACGKDKSDVGNGSGPQAPAPAPAPQDKPEIQPPTVSEDEGPRPIRHRTETPVATPRAEPRDERGQGEIPRRRQRNDGPQVSAPVPSVQPPTAVPRQQPAPAPQRKEEEEIAWFPPPLFESPARYWMYKNVDPVLKTLATSGPRPRVLPAKVKLTLALGYFDGFHDKPLVYEGENYGRHVAVDPFLRSIVDQVLTRSCVGTLQICGFERESGDDLETNYVRAGYDNIIQEIRVISGAYAVRHDMNTGALANHQLKRSTKAERVFVNSFLDSNLVVYVGHSRMGGGPDFRPPRLTNGKVNYAAYQKDRSGARQTARALAQPARFSNAFALLSCDSSGHFLNELRQAGRGVQIATVRPDEVSAENLLAGGFATMDLYLRQGHLAGLGQFASQAPNLANVLQLSLPSRMAER